MRYSKFKKLSLRDCLNQNKFRNFVGFFVFILALYGAISLDAVCNPYAIPTYKSGHVAFTIVNNSGSVSTSNLYVTIIGTDPANLKSCIVELTPGMDGKWVGTLVDATQFLFANHPSPSTPYSYQLSQIPTQNGQPVIYLPPIANATMYLSVGYGMGLNVSTGAPITIQPPQQFTTADANYYHLYDSSIFFTIADQLTIQSNFTTAFGLPVSAIVSTNSGTSIQYSGLSATRSQIFKNFSSALSKITNSNSQAQWSLLPQSFTSAGGGVTQLRLGSTLSAMNFNTPFDTTYLYNSGEYGVNWAQTVFDNGTPQLYFDVSGLTTNTKTYTYYEYTGISGGNLHFVPGTGSSMSCTPVTVPYPFTSSLPFLNAASTGASSFSAGGDALAAPLICAYLSAGFVTGLFPVTTSTSNLFGTGYLALANVNGQFYKNNPAFTSGTGPWYDLYAATLHNAASSTYFNFEADPVDASLGFFAPIVIRNNSNAKPAIFVVLNNLGSTVVPNFSDSNTYNIHVSPNPGAASYTFTYNGMTMGPYTDNEEFTNVTLPFTLAITYLTDTYSGQTFTSQVWVNDTNNYSVVFPQPPATLVVTKESGFWNIGLGPSP